MSDVIRTAEANTGHGHVFPRPDGMKARCGGPGICSECAHDLATKQHAASNAKDAARIEEPVDIEKKSLANLLDAVEGFLWFSWADGDIDIDAARAIDRLRLARDQYGIVQRIKNGQ